MKIRESVNHALEAKRQDKTIGTSLGARVLISTGGATAALLEQYHDELPMIFIVSHVDLDTDGDAAGALDVTVARADGEKCARCWRVVPSVSDASGTNGLCDRCVGALAALPGADAQAS